MEYNTSGKSSIMEHWVSDGKVADAWAMRCVLKKDTYFLYTYFSFRPSSLLVVAQPDLRLANRTQKSALCWWF